MEEKFDIAGYFLKYGDKILTDRDLEEITLSYGSLEEYKKEMKRITKEIQGDIKSKESIKLAEYEEARLRNGETLIDKGNLKELRRVNIVGQKVNNPEGAAKLFAVFRDPRIEIFNLVFLNKNKEVVYHSAWTCGLMNRVSALPAASAFTKGAVMKDYFNYLEEMMKKCGADYIMMAHNHPSGNIEPSLDDENVTYMYLKALGDKFLGHIIVDTNKYLHLKPVYDEVNKKDITLIKERGEFEEDLSKENEKKRMKRNAAQVIDRAGKIAKLFKGVMKKEEVVTALAVLDSYNKIVSWVYDKVSDINKVNDYIRISGGEKLIALTNDEIEFQKYCDYYEKGEKCILDIVRVSKKDGDIINSLGLIETKNINNNIERGNEKYKKFYQSTVNNPAVIVEMFSDEMKKNKDKRLMVILDGEKKIISCVEGNFENSKRIENYMKRIGGKAVVFVVNNENDYKNYAEKEDNYILDVLKISKTSGCLGKSKVMENKNKYIEPKKNFRMIINNIKKKDKSKEISI